MEITDYEQDTKRTNVEDDRLSNLHDDLIHKILSFIDIKHAIETSVLSSRWSFLWTSMPYLKFSTDDFNTLPKFSKFVTHVLSGRNNEVDVTSVKLSFRGKASQVFVKKILNYAFSHNVQELIVECLYNKKDIEFPLSLLCSQSLKHLILTGNDSTITSTWVLPALTTLCLNNIIFYDGSIDLFSNCVNLKSLTLDWCRTRGMNEFIIHHSRLSNLILEHVQCNVNVEAPQLKNLRLKQFGSIPFHFSADTVRSLENVDLISYPYKENDAHKVVGLLQQMHNVKVLTLNLELVEFLASNVELISHQPSPFTNLKRLMICPNKCVSMMERECRKEKVIIPNEVKNYLLDGSPIATLTMVSREEILAMNNTKFAQIHIAELENLLEQEKANTETKMAHMHEQGNTQPEQKMQPRIGVSMTQINRCWEDLSLQIVQKKEKSCHIISRLQRIEEILTSLPPSNRAKIQPRFSRLCAEADIVMNKITDFMKIQCDENQSRLSVCFQEIATALQLSS